MDIQKKAQDSTVFTYIEERDIYTSSIIDIELDEFLLEFFNDNSVSIITRGHNQLVLNEQKLNLLIELIKTVNKRYEEEEQEEPKI